jgi:hypothetical protein
LGGYGSGRPGIRPSFESALRIDLASDTMRSALSSSAITSGIWTWRSGDTVIGSVRYAIDVSEGARGSLRVSYTAGGGPTSQIIEMVTSRPNFGGRRWWFVCPAFLARNEHRLVRCVCLPSGQHQFASRASHRLNYQSQKDSRSLTQFIDSLMRELG